MKGKVVVGILASMLILAWAVPLMAADLSAILGDPSQFVGEKVSITAPVAKNVAPEGKEYKTWDLVVGPSPEQGLVVTKSGFNPATIVKAHALAEEAARAGEPVTVTGTLKAKGSSVVLHLDSIEYADTHINVHDGPFVQTVYGDCYPGSPLFYDGYTYYPGHFPY